MFFRILPIQDSGMKRLDTVIKLPIYKLASDNRDCMYSLTLG
jgi:hypothetical protein